MVSNVSTCPNIYLMVFHCSPLSVFIYQLIPLLPVQLSVQCENRTDLHVCYPAGYCHNFIWGLRISPIWIKSALLCLHFEYLTVIINIYMRHGRLGGILQTPGYIEKQPCHLPEETGVQLLCAASYGAETWTMTKQAQNKLAAAQTKWK